MSPEQLDQSDLSKSPVGKKAQPRRLIKDNQINGKSKIFNTAESEDLDERPKFTNKIIQDGQTRNKNSGFK